jgi:hypothetical protein
MDLAYSGATRRISEMIVGSYLTWPAVGLSAGTLRVFSPIWPAIFLIELANSAERALPLTAGRLHHAVKVAACGGRPRVPLLSGLSPVAAEKLGEQLVQLSALGRVQAGQQIVLGGVGVALDLFEVPSA